MCISMGQWEQMCAVLNFSTVENYCRKKTRNPIDLQVKHVYCWNSLTGVAGLHIIANIVHGEW